MEFDWNKFLYQEWSDLWLEAHSRKDMETARLAAKKMLFYLRAMYEAVNTRPKPVVEVRDLVSV